MRDKLIELVELGLPCPDGKGPFGDECETCRYISAQNCVNERVVDYLIANSVTVQEWIPVSERLPEDSGLTLVRVDFSMWDKKVNVPSLERYVNEEKTWFCDGVKLTNVTHWMPLPEVPKEVQ